MFVRWTLSGTAEALGVILVMRVVRGVMRLADTGFDRAEMLTKPHLCYSWQVGALVNALLNFIQDQAWECCFENDIEVG